MSLQPATSLHLKVLSNLLIIIGAMLTMRFALELAGVGIMAYAKGLGIDQVLKTLSTGQPPANWQTAILLLNAFVSAGTFIGIPVLYYVFFNKGLLALNPAQHRPNGVLYIAAVLLLVAFGPFNSQIVYWNEHLNLPQALAGFEAKARLTETRMQLLTNYLVTYNSQWQWGLVLLVVAVLPAIGEELFFRALLQGHLTKIFNPHVAIWLAAFIFSAIHFQFYGLVPRMLLGAIFGYMYWYSGRIEIPIACHFVNNAVTLTMMQRAQLSPGTSLTDLYAPAMPVWMWVLSVPATVAIGIFFVKYAAKRQQLKNNF